jgi:beta-mannanase
LPGGSRHDLYKSWLNKVAAFLAGLKGSHGESIPVILRLFHELNGDWFWWGGKHCKPEELKQLWHFTVAYLRDEKGLHNVLYAYNTDRFSSREAYLEKYPGDDWVDIVGFDIYQRGDNMAFREEFDRTLDLLEEIARTKNKIPALTEFGYNGLPDSTWWTQTFAAVLKGHRIAYALAWRNAGPEGNGRFEFYVPYKGQLSAPDFIRFYKEQRSLFQRDIAGKTLYR